MTDITHRVDDPEDMPLCPLCDNVIDAYEPAVVVTAFETKGLAHELCLEE